MVKDASTVDIVKLAMIRRGHEIAGDEGDVGQAARFRPRLRHLSAGCGHVEIGDFSGAFRTRELLRHHDQRITRATPSKERAKRLFPIAFAAKDHVINLNRI